MKERDNTTRTRLTGMPTKKRKPLISASERKRQAESLRTYRPGGDDAS